MTLRTLGICSRNATHTLVFQFNNKLVAQVAADMLLLLCDHVDILLDQQPEIPRRIIELIANVISSLLPSTENSKSEEDKRVGMIYFELTGNFGILDVAADCYCEV